ncbi:hypothetical protein [Arthrobacter rhombi]
MPLLPIRRSLQVGRYIDDVQGYSASTVRTMNPDVTERIQSIR